MGEVVLIKMAADGTPLGDKEKRQHGSMGDCQNYKMLPSISGILKEFGYRLLIFPIYLVYIPIGMLATDLCSVVGGPQQGPVEQRL